MEAHLQSHTGSHWGTGLTLAVLTSWVHSEVRRLYWGDPTVGEGGISQEEEEESTGIWKCPDWSGHRTAVTLTKIRETGWTWDCGEGPHRTVVLPASREPITERSAGADRWPPFEAPRSPQEWPSNLRGSLQAVGRQNQGRTEPGLKPLGYLS